MLSIPDPCITHGWHIRITVSGPGCSPNSRGIWLRRGWLLSPRTFNNIASSSSSSSSSSSKLPLLRFTLHMNIEFDEYVPLSVRRSTEFHLTTELISELKGLTNSNGWLQIASIITVTSISRDINCVIDPVRFSKLLMNSNSTGSKDETHSDIDHLLLHNMMTAVPANSSDENLPTNQRSMKAKGNQTEESQSQPSMSFLQQSQYRQSQLSGFSWPSNLPTAVNCSVNNIPVKSQKPYVMLIGFKATDRPEMGILASLPIIVQIPHR
ncbi:unnamed protein product [Trichobilharzia regenti]|nr:unnamed protein product [Trichobilharzia regenti]